MTFTFIHKSSNPFEHQLMTRGSTLSAYSYRVDAWRMQTGSGPEDWPVTQAEIDAAGIENTANVEALKESAQMSDMDEQLLDVQVKEGLKRLTTRLRINNSVPGIPEDFVEKANDSIAQDIRSGMHGMYGMQLDLKYWLAYYPVLDKTTAKALEEQCDADLILDYHVFALGVHFLHQSWTDDELKQWYEGMDGLGGTREPINGRPKWPSRKLTKKTRANLLAQMVGDVLHYMMQCVRIGNLEHMAMLVKPLPLLELKAQAEAAGIDVAESDNNKATLVLALVEHIFEDVLEPVSTA